MYLIFHVMCTLNIGNETDFLVIMYYNFNLSKIWVTQKAKHADITPRNVLCRINFNTWAEVKYFPHIINSCFDLCSQFVTSYVCRQHSCSKIYKHNLAM